MNIGSKLSTYTAQAGADDAVDKAERDEEYRDSLLGRVMYFGTAAMSVAQVGYQLGKTLQPVAANFQARRNAREIYNDNKEIRPGVTPQGSYDNFRQFYREEFKEPAREAMKDVGPMETIKDKSGNVIIEGKDRTSRRMMDRARVKAFYLNSVTNYQITSTQDGEMKFEQTTPVKNIAAFYPSITSAQQRINNLGRNVVQGVIGMQTMEVKNEEEQSLLDYSPTMAFDRQDMEEPNV